jgi:glutamate/tyrosine decarboxylase-like PLP-dependent enzyme
VSVLGRAAELAAGWLDSLPGRRVGATDDPDAARARFDGPFPERGTDPEQVLEQLAANAEPGLIASPGPRYFGFVVGGTLPVAVGADWLVSSWDQNAGLVALSPATAAIEATAGRWALEALRLPRDASVGFVTGATTGNVVGLAAARHHVLAEAGWDVEAEGLIGAPPVRVLVSEEVHVSALGALRLLGFGSERLTRVEVDANGAMRPGALERALGAGAGPAIVCAQAGNVNTGAVDPLTEVVAASRAHRAWVHVDGAFGLWAAASPRFAHLTRGHDGADSWSVDAHKWLNVPYDCAMVIVARPDAHRAALSRTASYLRSSTDDPFNFVPEMSRRARGVPVYAALRALGRDGVADLVERCCGLARRVAEAVGDDPGVEVLNDVVLNQVLLRFSDDDTVTDEVADRVSREGAAWLGGTTWQGRRAVRVSVSGWMTGTADIDRLVTALRRAHAAADPRPTQPA